MLPIAATASSDKTVRIYSLTNFQLLSTIGGGHKRSIRCVAWKPNTKGESVLATGSFDANTGIWKRWESDPSLVGIKGSRLGEDQEDDDDELNFTSGAGLGHGTEEGDGDDDEWRFSVVLEGHESEIKSVAWNASGRYLATCSRDKSVWIWECLDEDGMGEDNFETVAVLQEHDGDVKCVAWHPQEDLLASGSYDDCVRMYREDLDDWACCACLKGHGSTVWWVGFEPVDVMGLLWRDEMDLVESQERLKEEREKSGPRLVSCSDDLTVRIWRRKPKEREQMPTGQGRMPSILRTNSIEEDWYEDARLPQRHERAIYACSWSAKTGMIVSTGSDGKIVLYKERWKKSNTLQSGDPMNIDATNGDAKDPSLTEWVVVAEFDGAHDVYEVNHVSWAHRRDKSRKSDDEEMIISTGDDGEVKLWTVEEG
jgi:WD40 repeat protein